MSTAGTEPARRKQPRPYSRHGLNTLRRALTTSRKQLLSRRFVLGRALWAWRQELVDALGGPDAVSPQQLTLIELIVESKLLLDSVSAWLLNQASRSGVIDKRRRALLPVVRERQQLADSLARMLGQLGLERRIESLDLAQALRVQDEAQKALVRPAERHLGRAESKRA